MLKTILVLVYLYGGSAAGPELVVEQKVYATPAECQVAGGKRVEVLQQDPKFVEGYFAACIPAVVTEARK
jgi:hypothetical protein